MMDAKNSRVNVNLFLFMRAVNERHSSLCLSKTNLEFCVICMATHRIPVRRWTKDFLR
jgi:hypothetical protein